MTGILSYPKFVKVNQNDLELAIRQGVHPQLQWVDPKRDGLPYFWNCVAGEQFGNFHHFTFSASHTTGRRLEALTAAQSVLNIDVPEEAYENLEKWAYRVFDNPMRMMCNLDMETFEPEMVCDLHNLREVMYSFLGILRRKPEDEKARAHVLHLIKMVDKYTDYVTGQWKNEEFQKDTGGTAICAVCTEAEGFRFTGSMARYIEALMRVCQEFEIPEALEQALKLQKTFFDTVLDEDGSFSADKFCAHIHSVTAAICGIAMLGDYLKDSAILDRVDKFMKNGFYDIAIDIGWSTENDARNDWVGEINNSVDLMETCLYLAQNGYPGYYGRAEQMIRSHILPSQLLDSAFLPDEELEDDSISRMASRMKGAFGFPCPYGHEDEPGSEISFNWDIVSGGVSGLSQAYKRRTTVEKNAVSLNLLFDYEDENLWFTDPYKGEGIAKLCLKKPCVVKVRIPKRCEVKVGEISTVVSGAAPAARGVSVGSVMSSAGVVPGATVALSYNDSGLQVQRSGEWLYILNASAGVELELPFEFEKEEAEVEFKGKKLKMLYYGESLLAVSSAGKRLCYFPEFVQEDRLENSLEGSTKQYFASTQSWQQSAKRM